MPCQGSVSEVTAFPEVISSFADDAGTVVRPELEPVDAGAGRYFVAEFLGGRGSGSSISVWMLRG